LNKEDKNFKQRERQMVLEAQTKEPEYIFIDNYDEDSEDLRKS